MVFHENLFINVYYTFMLFVRQSELIYGLFYGLFSGEGEANILDKIFIYGSLY